ncbi:MAG: MBL fold metallo-hydrolase [Prolixibacteraceae bacterium]|nr:MBL fold metallo-hydrolase [Prolixibacteraceae bacterium]
MFPYLISIVVIITIFLYFRYHPVFGGKPDSDSFERIRKSPNFRNGIFQNPEPTIMFNKENSMLKTMRKFLSGTENGKPELVETLPFDKQKFLNNNEGISFTWFGHSTVLINLKGVVILTDPVFSKYASPVPFSNRAFKYSNSYDSDSLPDIDILLISHDHYDHLDYKTIKKIHSRVKTIYVPLGVEAHLRRWGVPSEKIKIADWGDNFNDNSGVGLTATPARHFAGRGMVTRNKTLWCSWVIEHEKTKVFFSGDSGYGNHFSEIGEKHGPFDFTMLECGQYNHNWPQIHSFPEQTVQAHIDLKGNKMLPIHWGKFKLSLHPWDEPIKRAKAEAEKKGVNLSEAQIGEVIHII